MTHIKFQARFFSVLWAICAVASPLHAQAPLDQASIDGKVLEVLDCYATSPADCAKELTQAELPTAEMRRVLMQIEGQFQRDGNMLAQLEMLQLLTQWYGEDPIAWVWHDKLARLHKKGWRNYPAAAEELEKSAKLQNLTHVRLEKTLAAGFSWYMAEHYEKALASLTQVESESQEQLFTGACLLLRAVIDLRQNKLEDSAAKLLDFKSRFPGSLLEAHAKLLLGYIYLQEGKPAAAAKELGTLSNAPGEALAPKLMELLVELPTWIEGAKRESALAENALSAPNVLIISLDTVRADHLGCYGYGRNTTPNIDALAAQGTLFENCSSTSSWTKTAHASIFTGLDASVHGAMNHTQAMAAGCVTLPQMLQEFGYATVGVISAPPLNSIFGFGNGFDFYDDYTYDLDRQNDLFFRSEDNALQIHSGFTGSLITETALRAYDRFCADRSFFLFVNYFDAHHNFLPPWPNSVSYGQPYYGTHYGFVDGWLQTGQPLSMADPPVDVGRLQDLYDGELQYVDMQVGRILEKLKADKRHEDTIVVLIGDHGEEFMEHGQLTHGRTLYNEVLHVPFIMAGPGVPKGKRVSEPVSQIDVLPTLLKLMGKEIPQGIDGVPLLPNSPDLSKRALFSKLDLPGYKYAAMSEGGYKLSLNLEDHQAELFDLEADPGEKKNVRDENLDIAMQMLDTLMLWELRGGDRNNKLGGLADTTVATPVKMFDAVVERLRALGYVK